MADKSIDIEATNIRGQEVTRGGLSYEVILAEPAPNVIAPKKSITPNKSLSAEDIAQKLKAAEERRLSLEAKKLGEISNKLAKIEEVTRKKDELSDEFVKQTKLQLETKMEQTIENREILISSIKDRLKTNMQYVMWEREMMEMQKAHEKSLIEEKLKTAQALREDSIKKIAERLNEHNKIKIAEVKSLKERIKDKKSEIIASQLANKLTLAEQNRERELQKKIEKIRQLERRKEIAKAQSENGSKKDDIKINKNQSI